MSVEPGSKQEVVYYTVPMAVSPFEINNLPCLRQVMQDQQQKNY